MWLAVIISVSLAVEVLTYLTGGEVSLNKKNEEIEPDHGSPEAIKTPTKFAA